jgi:hypothetical protein
MPASICTQEACSCTSSPPRARPSSNAICAEPDTFLGAVKPFRKNLVVGCECMFAWYWLADLCEDQRIPFVLGHALAMKHIHQGKAKSDKIDAGKHAAMLRGGMFPGETMTNLRPGLGSCTAELGHSRRPPSRPPSEA